MSSFAHLTDIELRNKLLEYGYDLPVSLNKAFLLRKLEKIVSESQGNDKSTKKSLPKTKKQDVDIPINTTGSGRNSYSPNTGTKSTRSSASISNLAEANAVATRGRYSVGQEAATYSTRKSIISTRSGNAGLHEVATATAVGSGRRSLATNPTTKSGRTTITRSTRASRVSNSPAWQNYEEQNPTEAVELDISHWDQPQYQGFVPSGNMFALIVSGRLVQSNFIQSPAERKKFAIDIPQADEVKNVVVFLSGSDPFPPGTGGQIYFGWNDFNPQEELRWHFLGFIDNDKPSAIFKVSDLKKALELYQTKPTHSSNTAQIGISIEPLHVIYNAQPTFETEL